MRCFILLLLLLFQVTPLAAAPAVEVRIGIDKNPPLTFIDDDGSASGLFPELLRQVASEHHWHLQFVPCKWQQCLEQLDRGELDMLPAIAYTEQRARKYRFAEETVFTSWGQVYRRADGPDIDSILQLNGKKLAVLSDDVYLVAEQGLQQVADSFGLQIDYLEADSYAEAFEKLAAGKVDAAMVGRLFGLRHRQQYQLVPAPILIKPIQVRPAFAQTAPQQLQVQFDAQLAEWKHSNNSLYYRLLEQWLGDKLTTQPAWLRQLFYPLLALLGALLLGFLWTRHQVRLKTLELEKQNRRLEDELIERQLVEKELAERNDFLQSVIDGVSDPLMVIDFNYRVLQMNEAAASQQPPELLEQPALSCHLLSHASALPCNGEDHPCPLREIRETGQPVTLIHNHINHKREPRIVELNASPLYNAAGELYAIIEVARDITERQQVEELLSENEKRLHHLAHHDPLTDLPNRLLFEDRLSQALSKARRSRKQVALFFLDLDHFKEINDNLGHDIGDCLLVDIANRLRGCIRESDTVARLGGDEFLVLLEEIDSLERVEQMAERICEALQHEMTQGEFHRRVSASVGISIYPEDGSDGQQLLKAADQAMYRAKEQGKATYCFASTPQAFFNFDP